MLTVRKMKKLDTPILYEIALKAFKADYDKYGFYPPLLNTKKQRFLPPRMFGNVILENEQIIGGMFIAGFGKNGEIGAIFLDPMHQHKGYGKKMMLMAEKMYPKVKTWKLETPSESYELHRFYESLGYRKAGEIQDEKSGMRGFIYKKKVS